MAAFLLSLPASWPGFRAWQAQPETFTPADSAAQSFVLEFDHPLFVEFPATFLEPEGFPLTGPTARVAVQSPTAIGFESVPVTIEREKSRVRVGLAGIAARAGSRLLVELRDPDQAIWVWAVRHDGYLQGEMTVDGREVGGDLAFRVVYQRKLADLCVEGLRVASRSGGLLLAAGMTIASGGLLLSGLLRRYLDLDLAAVVSSGVGGGLLTTAMLGLTAAILRVRPSPLLVAGAGIGIAIAGLCLWLKPRRSLPPLDIRAVGLFFGILLFGLLNLSFASELTLPPHFDSMLHYSLVSDLLAPERAPISAHAVGDLLAGYYHLGFHGMAAWIMGLAGDFTPLSLVVLGQLLQTGAVVSVYILVYLTARDPRAALGAFALAGIGWSMPGYASNWSKYPALLGLCVFGVIAGMAIIAFNNRGDGRRILYAAVGLMVFGAGLIHTRTLFLLAALALSVWLARRLPALANGRAFVRQALPLAILVAMFLAALQVTYPGYLEPVRRSLASLVENQGVVSTLLVLLLTPFALRAHRRAAQAALVFGLVILALQLVPPNGSYPFPIIDEPMAKMALFLPMSCLGGLGLAGLETSIHSVEYRPVVRSALAAVIVCLGVAYLARSLAVRDYAPGECCLLARQDDAEVALAASIHLSPESLTLIPGVAGEDSGPSPIDGGAWLFPLAHRNTVVWPADSDLSSRSEHDKLCSQGVTHVYVGGTPLSYSRNDLDLAPDFYTPFEVRPGAAIYAVVGCAPPTLGSTGANLR